MDKRVISARRFLLALFVCVLAYAFVLAVRLAPCLTRPRLVPYRLPLIWGSDAGLCMSPDGGRTVLRWVLNDRAGAPLEAGTRANFTGAELVYWSDVDRAICVRKRNSLEEWHALGKALSLGDSVKDIAATSRDILLTVVSAEGRPCVIALDRGTAEVARRPDLASAKSVPGGAVIVVRSSGGVVSEWRNQKALAMAFEKGSRAEWAYDPEWRVGAAIERGKLVLVRDARRAVLSTTCGFYSRVWALPERRAFLVCRQGAFGRADMFAIGYDGTNRGCYASVEEPVSSPVCQAVPGLVALLRSLDQARPTEQRQPAR